MDHLRFVSFTEELNTLHETLAITLAKDEVKPTPLLIPRAGATDRKVTATFPDTDNISILTSPHNQSRGLVSIELLVGEEVDHAEALEMATYISAIDDIYVGILMMATECKNDNRGRCLMLMADLFHKTKPITLYKDRADIIQSDQQNSDYVSIVFSSTQVNGNGDVVIEKPFLILKMSRGMFDESFVED